MLYAAKHKVQSLLQCDGLCVILILRVMPIKCKLLVGPLIMYSSKGRDQTNMDHPFSDLKIGL